MNWLAIAACVVLSLIHVFSGKPHFLREVPRSRWLSAAGGISVGYVLVHVLPELAKSREYIKALVQQRWMGEGIFLLALVRLVIFYGLERLAISNRTEEGTSPGVFWIHIGSFAVYNGLIGYLLARQEYRSRTSLLFFFIAMATHFVVNDHGLRVDHHARYDRVGRWLLASAALLGFGVGSTLELSRIDYELVFAFEQQASYSMSSRKNSRRRCNRPINNSRCDAHHVLPCSPVPASSKLRNRIMVTMILTWGLRHSRPITADTAFCLRR